MKRLTLIVLSLILVSSAYYHIRSQSNQVSAKNENSNLLLNTRDLSTSFYGWSGYIDLELEVDNRGILKRIVVLSHNETPRWYRKSIPWIKGLVGVNIFDSENFKDYDTLTGATYTTGAIKNSLLKIGLLYSDMVIEDETSLDLSLILISVFTFIALFLRNYSHRIVRYIFMAIVFIYYIFGGTIQYSTQHIINLLQFNLSLSLSTILFLHLLLPFITIIAGNIYCGYLCPFGIIQELVSDLGNKFKIERGVINPKYSNIRYILLGIIVVSALIFNLNYYSSIDLLLWIKESGSIQFVFGIAFIVISLKFNRLWCRLLCPTGAFLSIINLFSNSIFRWRYKIPRIGKCDLGIKSIKDHSCLCCDRCK